MTAITALPAPPTRWWRHPSLMAGLVITALILGLALLSLVWTPYDPAKLAIAQRLKGMSAAYWLGTDHLGRDMMSMLMRGGATALAVGLMAVILGMVLGVILGLVSAAWRGSLLDEAIMRINDFTFAFPSVLTAIMIAALAGPGMWNAVVAVAIFNVPVFARVTRSAALSSWARDYVRAARAMGLGSLAITVRHVAPNIAGLVIVQTTTQFALAILAEAGLSYLGLGTQPPTPSWGRMLYDAQTYIGSAPRLAILPGLAIALAVFGLNLLGDGLRDIIDPRRRRAL